MAQTRISLPLWLLLACSAPAAQRPEQPSPAPQPGSVTPEATTLKETEAQLNEEVARIQRTQPRGRFVTAYYVNDRSAADLLIDWFQRQHGVASAGWQEGVSRTHARGAGNRDAGAVHLSEEIWWEISVESPSKGLGHGDVAAWIDLLRRVPLDTRWRLGPSLVAQP